MKTTAERVKHMMEALNIKEQTEFGLLCGASRSTVNQWLSGNIKKIDPRYGACLIVERGQRLKSINPKNK